MSLDRGRIRFRCPLHKGRGRQGEDLARLWLGKGLGLCEAIGWAVPLPHIALAILSNARYAKHPRSDARWLYTG